MKNTLTDLNNLLFEALERLNDDDLTGEKLEEELRRTQEISKISGVIVKNAEVQLRAIQHRDEYGYEKKKEMPIMLEAK